MATPSIREFSLNIVGESRHQAEVKRCRSGERVELREEPTNAQDSNAIAVYSCRGVRIGHIAADRTDWIGGKLAPGYDLRAKVERVTGSGKQSRGIVLFIRHNARRAKEPGKSAILLEEAQRGGCFGLVAVLVFAGTSIFASGLTFL